MTPRESATTLWLFILGEGLALFFRFGTFASSEKPNLVREIHWWKIKENLKTFQLLPWVLSNTLFLVFQMVCYWQWGWNSLKGNSVFESFMRFNLIVIVSWVVLYVFRIIKNYKRNKVETIKSVTALPFDLVFLLVYAGLFSLGS